MYLASFFTSLILASLLLNKTMSKVHILTPDIISKIAAGEVIERPASVIKELVENALDAGAGTIEVQIKEAGRTLIRIKDNGHGIEREDLEKIFSRHATSKIETAEDLHKIQSLGFRGEALYSIGAIADVTLRSRDRSRPVPTNSAGWELHVRGGERLSLRPCALAGHGTEIEVKELFFNTPARRKFLKSNTTEIHQILNTLIPYTLFHNNVRFQLTHEDKDLIDVSPCADPKSRIAHVLHVDEKHLLIVNTGTGLDLSPRIDLILGDINIQRARRDMQFIFVNGRPVQNKSIGFHLNQVCRLIMPRDLYPLFVVCLQIPTEEIDVNIHPAKREVKIKDEQRICAALRQLCEQTLMRSGQMKQGLRYRVQGTAEDVVERALMGTHTSEVTFDSSLGSKIFEAASGRDYAYPSTTAAKDVQDFFIPDGATGRGLSLQKRLEQAEYVGSFNNKYLLFQAGNADPRSLMVVDQHAAAERVSYEQLLEQINKGQVEAQRLLTPVLIKLSPPEFLVWEEIHEKLDTIGLENNQWDQVTIAVHSYPVFLKDIEKAVRHILAGGNIGVGDHDALARRACRSSVMAGDILTKEKAEGLRERLVQCLDPFTCPHGRPTVVELSEDFFDKQFLRI